MHRTDDDLLSIDEVARTIGQSARTVRRMVKDGEFPDGFPAPRALRWRFGDVREWIWRHKLAHELRKAGNSTLPRGDNPGQSGTTKK